MSDTKMRYFCNCTSTLLMTFIVHCCDCYGYGALRITDYYWQSESVHEWMNAVYSNDCSFFNVFIYSYLIPMNMNIVHSTTNVSIEDYFDCNDSKPNSVAMAYDRCAGFYSDCNASQHFMFDVSQNSRYYDDINNDSVVDSLLNRKFVHFTMLYDTNATRDEPTDLALIVDDANKVADYRSYLTNIANYSKKFMYHDSVSNMSWNLVATTMSMFVDYWPINFTQLSQNCNLIYFDKYYNSDCYGLLTLENVTNSSYLKSTQFMDSTKTVMHLLLIYIYIYILCSLIIIALVIYL